MSLFKKTLATFGIGSAKVDSVLKQEVLYPGKTVNITIHVYGGKTEQEIDNINVRLCCRYVQEVVANRDNQPLDGGPSGMPTRRAHQVHELASWKLPYSFTIHPGETRDFEVELDVPWNTPVSIGDAKVWLETGLDIALAADPSDIDTLTVRPDPIMDGIFTALEEQGLRIRQVECEAVNGFGLPFVQEFEFVPTTGPYHGQWRELEIVANRNDDHIKLWFEIDRHRDGMKGMLASLLGTGKLTRELEIPLTDSGDQAGKKVVAYLDQVS
ncbi:sporulation protein [Vibrio olivae]|uniref:Sporulation protein n=1 Tax=Vibrio olivae TaxID=1243002 RepID=A0ABV5HUM0_9VIBR